MNSALSRGVPATVTERRGMMRTLEEAIDIYKEGFRDFTPWVWKPQWYWHGWKTLIPLFVGHDEYARRTLCIGWTITGRIIFPLWYCGSEQCLRESLEAIQNGAYDA